MTLISPFRFAKFRKQDRDIRSDEQRLDGVRLAVTAALASIDAELIGLSKRIELLRGWVGDLLGTDDGGLDHREGEAETELLDAERQLLAGTKRYARLHETRRFYGTLETMLEARRNIADGLGS